jgi:hypothetical protein
VTVLAAALGAASAFAPASASAASQLSGCFAYRGTPISGLSTNLEYLTTSNTWRWLGAVGHTNAYGCVSYSIWSPMWRTYFIRIRATGVVPAWRAVVSGSTPYYAGGDRRSYRLGTGSLSLSLLPATVPDPPSYSGLTAGWLDEMSGSNGSGNCDSSTAMQVACYMDAHGLHGNVVVNDADGDGVLDDNDNYPQDPTRW